MTARVLPLRAVANSFIERQWLDRPRGRPLAAGTLAEFAERTGGVQIDSINVLDRAHYLTLWSRFGEFDHAALDRLVYGERAVFEYWAHAACLVPRSHAQPWRRVMADYRTQHTGWSKWLKRNERMLGSVERAVRERGPLGNADFRERKPGGSGWWSWKPTTHALHFLWMTGRLLVQERVHFQKRFDLAERVLPELPGLEPPSWPEFIRWHLRQSLKALGAATETDLRAYLSFPKVARSHRMKALEAMLREGEVLPVALEGDGTRWLALAEELPAIEAAASRAPAGTTLLSPFDSLLWHRDRVSRLFGFDYRIEVYTPGHKRVHGYYSLPIYHDGWLIGRVDAKNHRAERLLEVHHAHFEPWLAKGLPPGSGPRGRERGAAGGALDRERALIGVGEALASLARFVGADRARLGRVTPVALGPMLRGAMETAGVTAAAMRPAAKPVGGRAEGAPARRGAAAVTRRTARPSRAASRPRPRRRKIVRAT